VCIGELSLSCWPTIIVSLKGKASPSLHLELTIPFDAIDRWQGDDHWKNKDAPGTNLGSPPAPQVTPIASNAVNGTPPATSKPACNNIFQPRGVWPLLVQAGERTVQPVFQTHQKIRGPMWWRIFIPACSRFVCN
jgi:hypothetical protein